MLLRRFRRPFGRGQALVEMALVLPLFLVVVLGVIVLGMGLFYQQQITNAAREAARYAAVHSATSSCPTSSRKTPNPGRVPEGALSGVDSTCDPPGATAAASWPQMQAFGRERAGFGFNEGELHFAACWSGYIDGLIVDPLLPNWDAPAFQSDGTPNAWAPCTIGGRDPSAELSLLSCPPPVTSESDDTASNLAASSGITANQVTVYACYEWQPPLAGFLLIPQSITLRTIVTESLQHQR